MKTNVAQKPAAWTEAHVQESNARTYDLAAEIHRMEYDRRADASILAQCEVTSESAFRCALREAGFDAARIDREVLRVRGLAEGRLVREMSERSDVITPGGGREDDYLSRDGAARRVRAGNAKNRAIGTDDRYRLVRVRVTRIRRA